MRLTLEDHLDMRHDLKGVLDRSEEITAESALIVQRVGALRSILDALYARYERALLQAGPEGEHAPEVIAARADFVNRGELIAREMLLEQSRYEGFRHHFDKNEQTIAAVELRLGVRPHRLFRLAIIALVALVLAALAGLPIIESLRSAIGL